MAGQLDIRGLDDALALAEHLSEYALEPGIHSLEELAREELSVIVSDPNRDLLTRHLNMEAYGAALLWRDKGVFSDYGYICRPDGQPLQVPEGSARMTKETFALYLENGFKGRRNVISSRELERVLGISRNELRRRVNRLRQDTVPIAADQRGYYFAETAAEVYDTIRGLQKMRSGLDAAISGLERALEKFDA